MKYDKNKVHYVTATAILVKDGKYLIVKRVDWEKNSEYYTYDHAKIGHDMSFMKEVEKERVKIMQKANRPKIADFLIGGKSWESYQLF